MLATAVARAQGAPAPFADTSAGDWRPLAQQDLIYLETARGRVVIELETGFAPAHVANIRKLVAARFFDGTAIVRAHDNYVVQWGDPDGTRPLGTAARTLQPEFDRPATGLRFDLQLDRDSYAAAAGFINSWPVAGNGERMWLAHCYAMVGVGRDTAPDSGNGGELYTVIGHAPRNLDRNVTLVGRVVEGIERLSSLPRGTEALGFYATPAERTPILTARMGDELAPDRQVRLEVLRSDRPAFARWLETRRNRRDDWYVRPAGAIDLCNVRIPIRSAPDR